MIYKRLGKRLRHRRKELKLSQEEVAEKADISCSFYGHIERGTRKLSMETFLKLIDALKFSADDALCTGNAAKKTASAMELLMLAEQLSDSLEEDGIEKYDD